LKPKASAILQKIPLLKPLPKHRLKTQIYLSRSKSPKPKAKQPFPPNGALTARATQPLLLLQSYKAVVSCPGTEATGAYKGSGLGMMVELFCGILADTPAGKDCRQWRESEKAANLAQCFVAVDPECFGGGFPERLQRFLDQTRELEPVDKDKPVLVAGDPERMHEKRSLEAGGLIYGKRQIERLVG
jgi:LDH2 family malate/lactate/ureidoglycolate dehydrogenase